MTHVNLALGFRGGERQTFNLIAGLARLGIPQTLHSVAAMTQQYHALYQAVLDSRENGQRDGTRGLQHEGHGLQSIGFVEDADAVDQMLQSLVEQEQLFRFQLQQGFR